MRRRERAPRHRSPHTRSGALRAGHPLPLGLQHLLNPALRDHHRAHRAPHERHQRRPKPVPLRSVAQWLELFGEQAELLAPARTGSFAVVQGAFAVRFG